MWVVALLASGLLLSACGGSGGDSGTTIVDTTTTETTTTETTETTVTTETTETTATVEPGSGTTATVPIDVVNGVPQGGIVRQTVDKGSRVVLVVTSDVADEIHVHGYDISRDVRAGGTARIAFDATLPGRFEVELEQRGTQIADLTVQP